MYTDLKRSVFILKRIILFLVTVFMLTGCSNVIPVSTNVKPTPTASEKASPTPSDNQDTNTVGTETKPLYSLTIEERKKLNIFFSNFAEAFFDEYDSNNYSSSDLIQFAFLHNRVNRTSPEEYDMFESPYFEYVMGFKASVMDTLINRYFGVTVPHKDTVFKNSYGDYEGWAFKDGYVYTGAATGESYDYFAIVDKFTDLGNGTYSATYDKYWAGYGLMDSKYYSYTPEQAIRDSSLEYLGSYIAIIKPAIVDGKETWQLLNLKPKN